jgi:hypothetical protein
MLQERLTAAEPHEPTTHSSLALVESWLQKLISFSLSADQ